MASENPIDENDPTPDVGRKSDVQPSNTEPNVPATLSVPTIPPTKPHCEITSKTEKDWWDKWKPLVEIIGIALLAIYTAYTIKMYRANKEAAEAARSAAATADATLKQIEKGGADTHDLAVAAGKQAEAARIANTTTREALTSVQRAFISFSGTASANKTISANKVTELVFTLPWVNAGVTPTKNAESQVNWRPFPGDLPPNFTFPDLGEVQFRQFEIPPREFGNATLTIPIAVFDAARKRSIRLFVWGWITYNDIFDKTPMRLSEFCDEIVDIKSSTEDIVDPSANITWQFSLCRTHNCSDEQCGDYKQRTQIKR